MSTLSVENPIKIVSPEGAALGPWATEFTCKAPADVAVYYRLANGVVVGPLTLTADYTLAGPTPETSGYSVTLTHLPVPLAAWPAGSNVILSRKTDIKQEFDFIDNLGLKPSLVKAAVDRLTRIGQELGERLSRGVFTPFGETGLTIPARAARKGMLATFNKATGEMETVRSLDSFDNDVSLTAANAEASAAAAIAANNSANISTAGANTSTNGANAANAAAAAAAASRTAAETLLLTSAKTNAVNNFTRAQIVSAGNATTLIDYFTLVPNDYGPGKPALYIEKSTTANRWDFLLFDSVNNDGQLNFRCTSLALNGVALVTTADVAAATANAAKTNLTNSFSVNQTIVAGPATTQTTFLSLVPTNFGAGKPAMYIEKSATATEWNILLFDGVNNNGLFNFRCTSLALNGNLLATVADVTAATANTAKTNVTNSFSVNQTIVAGPATTQTTFLSLVPTNFGAGKPAMYIEKSATATEWNILLFDGVNNNGLFNFRCTSLALNGNALATQAYVDAAALPVTKGMANIIAFGADPTGATASDAAFAAAVAYATSNCIKVYMPKGLYLFASVATINMTTAIRGLTIEGDGADNTFWITNSTHTGLAINMRDYSSVHIRGISFVTTTVNTSTALALSCTDINTNPANGPTSTIEDCTFRGYDGYAGTWYWATAISCVNVRNINFDNVNVCGPSGAWSTTGQAVFIDGYSTSHGCVYNFRGCNFNYLNYGIYCAQAEGVTLNQCNMVGVSYGFYVPASASHLDQFSATSCHFNAHSQGISINARLPNVMIAQCLFIVQAGGAGIFITQTSIYSIIGNTFNADTGLSGQNGIVISVFLELTGVITGNVITGLQTAIWLQSTSQNAHVTGNEYAACGTNILNQSAKNDVFDLLLSYNFASDAAALAGGVQVGGQYHNAGTVKVRLV